LSIDFSKNKKEFNEITTLENSSKYPYCYRINTFEFENGKIVFRDEKYHIDQSRYPIEGKFEEIKRVTIRI